ncbi:5'/3'-nucleotidase SurE [Aerophototrophica crusticola]|uniref:5'-nucleotidase SurE n=1 Tax=Aerophototrophica crusticola TaxID=1709002 RepID=A0A858R6K4_9PROT|nr:5'/3'-nucleotidase SurE [Rhodospirillaceae bacterium B3]
MQAPRFARALLTNDDGIDAPGLAVLAEAAAQLAEEVWVVAPEHDQSGVSRAVSLHNPLRVIPRGERRFAVTGTPSDCVILGVRHIMAENPPDIVLSGVNRGANIADELSYSGTVSAALAARLFGIPAYAFSQAFRDRKNVRWQTALSLIHQVVERFGKPETVLNVNFPDVEPDQVTGLDITRQGGGSLLGVDVETRTDTRGLTYHWLGFRRSPGEQADDTDIAALRRHRISVTPVGFDQTDRKVFDALRQMES